MILRTGEYAPGASGTGWNEGVGEHVRIRFHSEL
jgi:hypothetical protein